MKVTKSCIFALILIVGFSSILVHGQAPNVQMSFTVLDENGRFFDGLKPSDIQILQGKQVLEIGSFYSRTENPLEILLLIDASISQERVLPDEKKAAEYLIDNVLKSGKDMVAIARFTGRISLDVDLTTDFSNAKKQLAGIEIEIPAGYIGGGTVVGQNPAPSNQSQISAGSTSIWDSIQKALDALSQVKAKNVRKVIVLISDGVNTYGDSKLKDAILSSNRTGIPIFAIGIGDDFYSGVDKVTLRKLTEQTSGLSVIPKKGLNDLPVLIEKMGQALRCYYDLTFSPVFSGRKDSMQETKITIVNPTLRDRKLQIIQPKGYVSPK